MALKVKIGLNSEIVVLKSRDVRYFLQIRALRIRAIHRFYR